MAWARTARFHLALDGDDLMVHRTWRAPVRIPLRGSEVAVDTQRFFASTGFVTRWSARWMLTIAAPDGRRLEQQLPFLGVASTEPDDIELRSELQARA